ncbi:DUF6414 family protein [Nocardiopsis tropica]|uniref:Peptidylprolyl isomerase n=1 Tax=Nocardiopsis tropica TaxID=109330 RepID=A0ABU7KP15_9ACTN|nr:hypothetical protein [Nocardiopsis umidischolae]MEE2051040.1 hypothetical protein [Nocardiopsis umidischolae]
MTSEMIATRGTNTQTTQGQEQGDVKASVELGFSGIGKANFGGGMGGSNATGEESLAERSTTRNFLYSQSYYLSAVRNELKKRNLVRYVTSKTDAKKVNPGDFVEYTAYFTPNQINALLDIATPELIAEITRYIFRMKINATDFNAFENPEEMRQFALNIETKAQAAAELSSTVAKVIRTDFRANHTREFYGQVGEEEEEVTAITICDNEHFIVQDEDRMLDGHFTVLGKVTSAVEEDVPILARNKLLNRVHPEVIDSFFDELKVKASDSNKSKLAEDFVNDAVDVALDSRISGDSFRVIPIAVFA